MPCHILTQTSERISNTKRISSILFICIFFNVHSCNKNSTDPQKEIHYEVPVQTNDGWETASLLTVGMDEKPLLNLLDKLNEQSDHRIHSILFVKDGKLVFEEYFPGEKIELAKQTG